MLKKMLRRSEEKITSGYKGIYDVVVPKDNMLREIKEHIDFSFIYEEIKNKYSLENGRPSKSPIMLFKYLLLKCIYDLSDVDIVERSKYDMSFKYFLDMAPEEGVINASLLTKFRKLRLEDTNLIDKLINKTVSIALEKGIIKTKSIIVDATHTKARYNQKSPREILQERSKQVRKVIYTIDEKMKEKFPIKNTEDNLEKEMDYCNKLIKIVKENENIYTYPKVREKLNLLEETMEDDMDHLKSIKDTEARIGHKTKESSFFGYKTHIAMTEERIITAATITTGEKSDGKELEDLYKKSKENGIEIDTIIGDSAYSEKNNIKFTKKEEINLVAKLNPCVSQGCRKKEDEFEFNKDAGMYVCKAGHMSIKKAHQSKKDSKKNPSDRYYFDIEKCKRCPIKEGCYKEGAKSKTYIVTIKSDLHKEQIKFENSQYFKEKSKERYKIEAKNSELKNRHGYDVASSSGLIGMNMQGALAIFTVNIKRILKLIKEK